MITMVKYFTGERVKSRDDHEEDNIAMSRKNPDLLKQFRCKLLRSLKKEEIYRSEKGIQIEKKKKNQKKRKKGRKKEARKRRQKKRRKINR